MSTDSVCVYVVSSAWPGPQEGGSQQLKVEVTHAEAHSTTQQDAYGAMSRYPPTPGLGQHNHS